MAREPAVIAGWGVGGVNVKGALVEPGAGFPAGARTVVRPFEVWRGRELLPDVLRDVAEELGISAGTPLALTMTAELSDAFRDKREGVLFVVDAVAAAFPHSPGFALDVRGEFAPLGEAHERPLEFAATNWVASALVAAARLGDCILVDVGSTTTDIVPVRGGRLACEGHTDLERLAAGELVYTGVVRTNPNTLARTVPVRGRPCRVAAEHFAVMGDAYVLLGRLDASAYTSPTPDGREVSPSACGERLARLVCGDRETLAERERVAIAGYLVERQLQVIGEGLLQVVSRWEGPEEPRIAAAGAGAFVAAEVAGRLGLDVVPAASTWAGAGVALPAAAAAWLLAERLTGELS